jgi:hypothetical protein
MTIRLLYSTPACPFIACCEGISVAVNSVSGAVADNFRLRREGTNYVLIM